MQMTRDQDVNVDVLRSRASPFGGLMPDTVQGRVLQEIAADPFSAYSVKTMAELTECSSVSVSRTLKHLSSRGILSNLSKDRQHPLYVVKEGCRTINALIFMSLAWQDDIDGSDMMDACVRDYALKTLGMKERNKAPVVAEIDGRESFPSQRSGRKMGSSGT